MLCEITFSLMCMWYIWIINRFYVETWIPFPSLFYMHYVYMQRFQIQ